ncbi:MAG: 1,4-alpha-glucan branching protein GlgB [Rhodobacteraceae bacterium]|nr:1,4-alpha-glucan branching protein GlgB [Paracoccaceae bacterium]
MGANASPNTEFPIAIAQQLVEGTCAEPFRWLGLHRVDDHWHLTVFAPGAEEVAVLDAQLRLPQAKLARIDGRGLFSGAVPDALRSKSYRLRARAGDTEWTFDDPYRFGPVLGELDEHLLAEGAHMELWTKLGAHLMDLEGATGTHFAVWAPGAARVSVVGDFNAWDGRRHVMRSRGTTGVWEIFLPDVGEGAVYKYEIRTQAGEVLLKADPLAFGSQHPPETASVVRDLRKYAWTDTAWMRERAYQQRIDRPISIYEVHLGSWRRVPEDGNRPLSYLEHAVQLVDYVADMGFTHIELMPISEHPFDGSWGYQPTGMYAPTIRYGTPAEFRKFVEACHAANLGLILDWVPGHFPTDAHGLGQFDGTALYEHADPREGFHQDWNTLIYNFGRREVQNFLVANALYWLEEYHLDGLRVDAVASMLYRDYSRKDGEWVPNHYGGRENLEAIAMMQRMNTEVYGKVPGIITVAEESTAWPGVSRPADSGGLGFGFKWNMGWMNDTLDYMQRDPIHRQHHHHQMTFGLNYAFTENFILPISHDEVVHGKGSMIAKMPAEGDAAFANLRAYYGFMWGHPGKKLLFMGQEFAQGGEWNHDASLDWHLLDDPRHAGMQALVRDLNRLYRKLPALHLRDCDPGGFQWIEVNSVEESIYVWARYGAPVTPPVIVISNFTPVTRGPRRIGVPADGFWTEALNTESSQYGGSDVGNFGGVASEPIPWSGMEQSIEITVPAMSTLMFVLRSG